jgi:hypothetical protein
MKFSKMLEKLNTIRVMPEWGRTRPEVARRIILPGSGINRFPTDQEVIDAIMSVPAHFADLAITATAVQPGAACQIQAQKILGATLTAGQAVYADQTTTNPVGQLKATLAGGTTAQKSFVGVLLSGGNAGQATQYASGGQIIMNAVLTIGTEYYMSQNAGGICPSGDLVATNEIVRIGFGVSTTILQFDIRDLGVHP